MDIFENLENLEVSEACFEEIIAIAEEFINEYINELELTPKEKKLAKAALNEAEVLHPVRSGGYLKYGTTLQDVVARQAKKKGLSPEKTEQLQKKARLIGDPLLISSNGVKNPYRESLSKTPGALDRAKLKVEPDDRYENRLYDYGGRYYKPDYQHVKK